MVREKSVAIWKVETLWKKDATEKRPVTLEKQEEPLEHM